MIVLVARGADPNEMVCVGIRGFKVPRLKTIASRALVPFRRCTPNLLIKITILIEVRALKYFLTLLHTFGVD